MNLTGILRDRAAERPDATALIHEGVRVSYGEFDRRVDQVATALRASGVRPGDRVAVLDKNSLAYAEVLFGAARAGAVQVPINYRLSADEIAYIVDNSKAPVLVVGHEFLPMLDAIADRLEHTEHLIVVGGTDHRYTDYDTWTDGDAERGDESGEVFVQLYSSGTTGRPKGVMLTHENFLTAVPMSQEIWNLRPDSALMVAMPMYHIAGCILTVCAIYDGIPCVIVREPDPVRIARAVEAHKVTHVFLVPVLLLLMQQLPQVGEADLSSLRLLIYGASPISEDVLRGAMGMLPSCDFMQVYGLTETTGAISHLPPADHMPDGTRLRSAGIANPGTELKIIDPATSEPVPTGRVGEIVCRSPQNMKGYWSLEQATRDAMLPGGWLRTGDAGYLDEDGYLYIHDRVKDMIISGGENIYPAEVENVLMSHPAVADCAVIGVPDEKWGETPKAIVVRDGEVGERELIDFCRSGLAHFKCPTSVEWTDSIPRNPTGKVLKRDLRKPYWEHENRAVR
ncbi:long-chain-fatty-acid--CoA ligase [Actinoallomurus purpureus]|uniref:long-chain-fatty-acid--CoA ligase n=1 Tax=Actinoallomurus purpureus TaxID=478114 RepID=UPI0020921A79|nr:long-chain-fatty-acid--CoA ligase [Actinoallomurus purpureus]MCO6007413.1 long-chain-fatty-acid--CoA ligase [Actinoallomurus purpureus]